MKRDILIAIIASIFFVSLASAFYLYIGQSKAEVIAALGEPNYTDESADSSGRTERCQWGSERVGTMVVIWFKKGKVIKYETKGKVR